jgi:hypothetical protein
VPLTQEAQRCRCASAISRVLDGPSVVFGEHQHGGRLRAIPINHPDPRAALRRGEFADDVVGTILWATPKILPLLVDPEEFGGGQGVSSVGRHEPDGAKAGVEVAEGLGFCRHSAGILPARLLCLQRLIRKWSGVAGSHDMQESHDSIECLGRSELHG